MIHNYTSLSFPKETRMTQQILPLSLREQVKQ